MKQLLLELGADPNIHNCFYYPPFEHPNSPIYYAKTYRYILVPLLLEYDGNCTLDSNILGEIKLLNTKN